MKIVAHRGASRACPENTRRAFERALAIGVDGIEADLLMTKEGRIVVRHDDLIQHHREWYAVRELTFEELQQIDVGEGERLLLFEQFLEAFYGRALIILDLKTFGLAAPLASWLEARGAIEGVEVSSFLHAEIVEMARRLPSIGRSLIVTALPMRFEWMVEETGAKAVALHRSFLNESITRQVRHLGIAVRAYPVNLPREASRFASWGVDAIYTDDPAAMQALRTVPRP
jgi:glycerophosphoryl diester phosphodiesterase